MSRSVMIGSLVVGVLVAVSAVTLGIACHPGSYDSTAAIATLAPTPATSTAVDRDRRDCPGHEFHDTLHEPGSAKFAGIRSQVAEFHDCQRFILGDRKFHGLYALFAAVGEVKPATIQQDSAAAAAASRSNTVAFAAGEVVTPATGEPYGPLGVRPGYNCLYLTRPSSGPPMALMLPVGTTDETCPWVIPADQRGATRLHVVRWRNPDLHEDDYPNAARWQFAGGEYHAGVKCGAAWCEIGGPTSQDRALPMVGTGPWSERVRQTVPGWSDSQELARVSRLGDPPTASADMHVVPSRIEGTVTPVAALGGYTVASFDTGYTVVGTITITRPAAPPLDTSYSRHKLLLAPGRNVLSLHHVGDERDAGWTARIVNGDRTTYFDVVRKDHMGLGVPGTLRWRWLSDDDTVWARCDDGCCQVLQKG